MRTTNGGQPHTQPGDSADPGDLGRRVAHRRAELGLARGLVAERSGLDPGFLEYLETQSVPVGVDTLTRLADALDTTVTDLLGGGHSAPVGRSRANARVRTEELDRAACWEKLGPGGVGRVVLTTSRGPAALPVNYRVLDATVLYRTVAGGTLAGAADSEVAFEVDQLDETFATGWSVLLNGTVSVVPAEEAVRRFRRHADPRPWAGGTRDVWMRIKPAVITGRIIRPGGPPIIGASE
ncbi:pyridoxamine 5'-phosphate oxidase family protein [Kitasatospora sp. CM 4170]|uniref:Helix-turn-helix domain-containing protein n=1 Tax=Kitasatospora aburaviensis TaxID=67265 RepID=A0ABW1F5I5_9ACTN|nr:pyridoxamine 5'-phosphate oxidase family protein [Kitasatospora sp. CM 4170]WNM43426.1 pyridoxamine 5'-phosphate oxidase family protein [Kitasatospora sp. CM 4170]